MTRRSPHLVAALLLVAGLACASPYDGHRGGATPSSTPEQPAPPDRAGSATPDPRADDDSEGCAGGTIPPAVQSLLKDRCVICHNATPPPGVPGSLDGYEALLAPAKSDGQRTMAEMCLQRMQEASKPMPPAPLTRATSAEIRTFDEWVRGGMQLDCPPGPDTAPALAPDGGADASPAAGEASGPLDAAPAADGGTPARGAMDAAPAPSGDRADAGSDPFATPAVCTSGVTNTSTKKSPLMQPGNACIACHGQGQGPKFAVAGTVYPTAHEPSSCNGTNGTSAQVSVVVVDANNRTFTMQVNAAGNFYLPATSTLTPPLRSKVVSMGRERPMVTPAPSGDCNGCHTQNGTTTQAGSALRAPGRILLP